MKLKIISIVLVLKFSTAVSSFDMMPESNAAFEALGQCMTPLDIGGGIENESIILNVHANDLECVAKKIQDQFPEKAQQLREEAQKTREKAKTYEIFKKRPGTPKTASPKIQ